MKALVALILRIFVALGLYSKGRIDSRNRQKLKNAQAKVKALEAKVEVAELTDAEVAAELSEWQK